MAMNTSEGIFEAVPQAAYAVGMKSSKKNEDRFLVNGKGIPGIADAFIGIFDGHNGDGASEFLQLHMLTLMKKHPVSDTCNEFGWPSNIDTIISSTFLKMDAHVQELMGDGSTCTIILLKQFEDLVSAKVAWVGDSRCTLHVKHGYQDLVVDHRADNAAEQTRIMEACMGNLSNNHLAGWRKTGMITAEEKDKLFNVSSVLLRKDKFAASVPVMHPAVMSHHSPSRPERAGGKGEIQVSSTHGLQLGLAKQTQSVHGAPRLESLLSRVEGSTKGGKFMASYHGMVDPFQHEDKSQRNASKLSTTTATGLLFRNNASAREATARTMMHTVTSQECLSDIPSALSDDADALCTGEDTQEDVDNVVFLRRSSMCGIKASPMVTANKRRDIRRSMDLSQFDIPGGSIGGTEGSYSSGVDRVALWTHVDEGSSEDMPQDPSHNSQHSEPDGSNRGAPISPKSQRFADNKAVLQAMSAKQRQTPKMQIFNKQYGKLVANSQSTEMDKVAGENHGVVFCGRYQTEEGVLVGNARVFLPTGVSVMNTRCIGDRDARKGSSHAIVSMPQISDVRLDPSEGGRLVLASDGLWDVIDTIKVHKIVKGQATAHKAVRKLIDQTMSDIIYRGLTMDDITVIVIDVGLDIFKNKKNLNPTSALLISSNAPMMGSTGNLSQLDNSVSGNSNPGGSKHGSSVGNSLLSRGTLWTNGNGSQAPSGPMKGNQSPSRTKQTSSRHGASHSIDPSAPRPGMASPSTNSIQPGGKKVPDGANGCKCVIS